MLTRMDGKPGAIIVAATCVSIALASVADCSRTTPGARSVAPPPHGLAFPTYHFDRARTGWTDAESTLVPSRVAGGLTRAWATAPFDDANVAYQDAAGSHVDTFAPRLFASPLYADDVTIDAPPYAGLRESVLYAATTNDWVYAVAAVDAPAPGGFVVQAGTILWRAQVGTPAYVPALDHGTPLGVLSTPILDLAASPPTLYVTAVDATAGWQVFALDARSGAILPGWPVAIAPAVVGALDRNVPPGGPPPAMAAATVASQRSALQLSQDGATLFVPFGSYYDGAIGWMVAVDVRSHRVAASFSGSPVVPTPDPSDPANLASAGMWGAGGVALASDGRAFITTGNSPHGSAGAPGVWGNSLLAFEPDLTLSATYSPFNYCLLDLGDTDLGGSSPVVFDVDPSLTSTPHLATFGGKQGVVYLVDRDHLGGSTTARPACDSANPASNLPSSDTSLYGPDRRPQYAPPSPGPLPVFGPYSDAPGDNALDHAKMRTTPALFRPATGDVFVYVAGTSRDPSNLDRVVPPCVARLRVVLAAGHPAYFASDVATNTTAVMQNPGSPVVSSHDGGQDAVVWVLDQNARRTDPVEPKPGFTPPGAVLYAFDGQTMSTLWQSAPGDIGPSGKYGHVVVAHGTVFVASDGITAFVAGGR
jgi:hypothetical protein